MLYFFWKRTDIQEVHEKRKCNISSWCKLKDGLQSSLDTLFFMHVEYHQITDVKPRTIFPDEGTLRCYKNNKTNVYTQTQRMKKNNMN